MDRLYKMEALLNAKNIYSKDFGDIETKIDKKLYNLELLYEGYFWNIYA